MLDARTGQANLTQKILALDVFLYRRLDALMIGLPGRDKRLSLFLLLCVAELVVAALDISVGSSISLRPLYIPPLLVAAIFLTRTDAYLLSGVAVVLRLTSFRLSTVPESESFPLLFNLLPTLLTYFAITEFATLAMAVIRELQENVETLQGELLRERLARMTPPNGAAPDAPDD
jgi:hypothetical protein